MFRLCKIAGSMVLATLVMACEGRIGNHGFAPDPEILATVETGVDTRDSVQRKIGRPSTSGIFTEQGWYYIATTIKTETYKEPEVIDRRIVAIEFDENDVVASIDEYGLERGRIVNLQTRVTPTAGRDVTVIEQALGNIGVTAEDITQ